MMQIPDRAYVQAALALVSGKTLEEAAAILDANDETVRRWRKGEYKRIGEKTRHRLHALLTKAGALPQNPTNPTHPHGSYAGAKTEQRKAIQRLMTMLTGSGAVLEVLALAFEIALRDGWPEDRWDELAEIRRELVTTTATVSDAPLSLQRDAAPAPAPAPAPKAPAKKKRSRSLPSTAPARKRGNGS